MKKWLVVGGLVATAAIGAGAFALRDPGALAGSVARPCQTYPCAVAPARADFCGTDYCGHGGPGAKAGWCIDDYCGHTGQSASH